MISWQTTRNTHEAAALAALDIPVRPVTALDHKKGIEITDWNLARDNAAALADPARHTSQLHSTGPLRRDYNGGQLRGGLLAAPLHPFLIGIRALHNRARLIDTQRGKSMILHEEAPGACILMPGSAPAAAGPHIDTHDLDLAAALITVGCSLIAVRFNGSSHIYRVTRLARSVAGAPCVDGGALMTALRDDQIFPQLRWQPFAHAYHTLHTLRELRRHQHTTRFITVSHKTFHTKGAAFNERASGELLQTVQRKLGIRL